MPDPVHDERAGRDPHATLVRHLWLGGAARWPSVKLALDEFSPWITTRLVASDHPEFLCGEDLYLVCGVELGRSEAVAAVLEEIARATQRVRPKQRDRAAFEELDAALREKLLTGACKLREYSGTGNLRKWLAMVAMRTHLDATRSKARRPEDVTSDEAFADIAAAEDGPELSFLKRHYGAALRQAFVAAAAGLPAPVRLLLRQHYLLGLTLDELATLYGAHRVTIARRMSAARLQLAQATRRTFASQLAAKPDEVASVVALVMSRLEQSLSSLLAEPAGSTPD